MRVRFPLYGKISIWFFLNLIALAAVFVLLFNAQFNLNLDWLLATGARERLEAVRDLIVGELNRAPPDEWAQILERYSEAHHVRFALFDDEANPLVGNIVALPEEVRARILARPPFPDFRRSPGERAAGAPQPPEGAAPRPFEGPRRPWPRPSLRAILRTSGPTLYWLLASARLDNPQTGDPMRVVLVARSSSMAGGGLIFNPTPWLALGLGAVVFSLLFWLPLVRSITRSVKQMTHATRQIADGRFDVRVNPRRRDELGALGEAIDQMAVRLDGFVVGQKRFLGDIAHELCSPLARLQMALGILEQRAHEGETTYIESATEKAEQIASLVAELLSFSKASFGPSAVHLEPVRVREATEEAIRREKNEEADIRLDVPERLWVAADANLLIRALANLLRNALRHASRDGIVLIQARRNGPHVSITVADSGPGVPEEELPRIFDAFHRVDRSRTRETGGVGLGLTIVKACIDSCGGMVTARNREPHGLEVTVQLSAAAEENAPSLSETPG